MWTSIAGYCLYLALLRLLVSSSRCSVYLFRCFCVFVISDSQCVICTAKPLTILFLHTKLSPSHVPLVVPTNICMEILHTHFAVLHFKLAIGCRILLWLHLYFHSLRRTTSLCFLLIAIPSRLCSYATVPRPPHQLVLPLCRRPR